MFLIIQPRKSKSSDMMLVYLIYLDIYISNFFFDMSLVFATNFIFDPQVNVYN